mgnify:CR=1 FL=1
MRLLLKEESYAVRGAIFEVYNEMGGGFLEAVYQECLENELTSRHIPFIAQPELKLHYKGNELKQTYKPDFICYEQIIVELKAVKETTQEHKAQVINYLKATNLNLALLVNFGNPSKLEVERLVL